MDNITVINCNLIQYCYEYYLLLYSNAVNFCKVVIIDPGISNANGYQPFTDGNQMGVFIKVRHTYICGNISTPVITCISIQVRCFICYTGWLWRYIYR